MAARAADDWSAAPFGPESRELDVLAEAATSCAGCPLYVDTTQTVFGAGPADATIILVGEQPGDREDRAGQPFVGLAGRVLQDCLDDAGIVRDGIYMTNAVKHFQHERRGSPRLHRRPTTAEVDACHPWLDAELAAVPGASTVVALGATAPRGLLGTSVPIAASRGRLFQLGDRRVIVTYHPSAVPRVDERAREIRDALVEDLKAAAEHASP